MDEWRAYYVRDVFGFGNDLEIRYVTILRLVLTCLWVIITLQSPLLSCNLQVRGALLAVEGELLRLSGRPPKWTIHSEFLPDLVTIIRAIPRHKKNAEHGKE